MAKANVARRRGDDFQARIFWLKAAQLLDDSSPLVRVCYEKGPRAFDDIQLEYKPGAGPRDHEGEPIVREFVQCKWHVHAGTFGYQDLVDPAFVNANNVSLLQRALDAQRRLAPNGRGIRFELLTNWRIAPKDPLMLLIGKSSDAIDVERLFSGKTQRSAAGKVRKLWQEHLGIDDDELRKFVSVLAVAECTESLHTLRERLDERFAVVGLRQIPPSESGFLYDDLIFKLLGQGHVEYDRNGFRDMAKSEGILIGPMERRDWLSIGVRSFVHPIDHLENRCDDMLDLVPYFDGRYVRKDKDWQERIAPSLKAFLVNAADQHERLRLVLDVHVSLAYAAGAILNVKSGRSIQIEQRTLGRCHWSPEDAEVDPSWAGLEITEHTLPEGGDAIAVSVSLTHDISTAVDSFILDRLPDVGTRLHCKFAGGPSQQSVQCGRHAWQLAEETVARLLTTRERGSPASPVHLFIAGPNGFVFFLGQQTAIGKVCMYEWDFDGQQGGGYSPGITLQP